MTHEKTTLIHDLRSLPKAFWTLFVGMGINRFGTFVFPFLTIVLRERGVSLPDIGFVLTGFGVGMLGSTLAGGWFADRFGRKNTIACGTFLQAAAFFALYFTTGTFPLFVLTTLAGFAGGFYHPAASALVADLVPPGGRVTAFTLLRLAGNGGFAFGTAAGGLLVKNSPFWLFAGNALATMCFGLLALAALPHGIRQARGEAKWAHAVDRLRGDGAFWALALAQTAIAFIFAQYASAYALEVTRRGLKFSLGTWNLSPEQIYGMLIGWNGILIMLLELPLTRVTRAFATRRVMALGYLLVGIGFATNVLDLGIDCLVVGMTLFTLGEMLVMPMVGSWISHLAPENMRGRYMGALAATWAIGNISGQNIGMRLFAWHPTLVWIVCAVLGLGAAILITLLGRSDAEVSEVATREPAVVA